MRVFQQAPRMRRPVAGLLLVSLFGGGVCAAESSRPSAAGIDALDPTKIRAVAARVADWQLDHPKYDATDWTNAVFYAGLMAASRVTGDSKYVELITDVGERSGWRPGVRYRHADDHAIAQSYLELFRINQDPRLYAPFRSAIDRMMIEPANWAKAHQVIDYWWCDALFMSPPALAMLAAATGDGKYLDFMERLWREAYELLYDHGERLFHRDLRFREQSDVVFWARGNGWVLAGLARLLEQLPEERPSRIFYESVFRDLSGRIVELQGEDGLWRSNLLGHAPSDPGESSGSALLCFALAWGINHGALDREDFLPVVIKAWTALYRNVDEEGRLGWVQKPGARPGRVSARHAEVYASGAFLLAAEQVLALQPCS